METNKQIMLILILSFLLNFYLGYGLLNSPDTNSNRLERIELMLNYTKFYYHSPQYGLNTNLTLEQVRGIWLSPDHKTHKLMAANVMLGYVCDGSNAEVIKLMVR